MADTLTVNTTRFGDVAVHPEDVYEFPEGILGFSRLHRYVLMNITGAEPFKWLQSMEEPSIAFVVADPATLLPDYRVEAHPEDLESIRLRDPDDHAVLVILVIPADPKQMTVNLQGPLVFNTREKLAKQVVLIGSKYPADFRLFQDDDPENDPST